MMTHSDEKPFKCAVEGCDKCFKSQELLKQHSRCHTVERNFKCERLVCVEHAAFKSLAELRLHEKRVHTLDRAEHRELKLRTRVGRLERELRAARSDNDVLRQAVELLKATLDRAAGGGGGGDGGEIDGVEVRLAHASTSGRPPTAETPEGAKKRRRDAEGDDDDEDDEGKGVRRLDVGEEEGGGYDGGGGGEGGRSGAEEDDGGDVEEEDDRGARGAKGTTEPAKKSTRKPYTVSVNKILRLAQLSAKNFSKAQQQK